MQTVTNCGVKIKVYSSIIIMLYDNIYCEKTAVTAAFTVTVTATSSLPVITFRVSVMPECG